MATFEEMALEAMSDIGLPEDEAEMLLEDYIEAYD